MLRYRLLRFGEFFTSDGQHTNLIVIFIGLVSWIAGHHADEINRVSSGVKTLSA